MQVLPAAHFGKPPIHHIDLAKAADHNVCRLEIAMKHAFFVRIRYRLASLHYHADGAPDVPALFLFASQCEHFTQGASLHQSHSEERLALGIAAGFVNGHDARMIELSSDLRFL